MVKYRDIFNRCLAALTQLVTEIADEAHLSGPYAIISQEGLEQVGGLQDKKTVDRT